VLFATLRINATVDLKRRHAIPGRMQESDDHGHDEARAIDTTAPLQNS
jgi:hypothetical protein